MAHPLDNVVWNALSGSHAGLGEGGARARRYRPEVARFAGLAESTPAAQAELAALLAPGDEVALVDTLGFEGGPRFEVLGRFELVQMVATRLVGEPADAGRFEPLGEADIAQMTELVERTKPGPFQRRTIDFGGFVGHKVEGRLVAMGGHRMRLEGFAEVSGICTDPAWRGRGLARDLVLSLARGLMAEGRTPFLHAFADNHAAIGLYEKLGFTLRARPKVTRLRLAE